MEGKCAHYNPDDGCGLRTPDSLVSLGFVIWVLLHPTEELDFGYEPGQDSSLLAEHKEDWIEGLSNARLKQYFQLAARETPDWAGVSVVVVDGESPPSK